jgi:hypothetical protein
MQDNHDMGEAREQDETEGGAAGVPIVRRRLTIGARATLLMGLGMGTIAAAAALSAALSRTVSSP